MLTSPPVQYRRRRNRPAKSAAQPEPPPSTDTLVTEVMAAPANQALWTFDHDVTWDGVTPDESLKINGASPVGMASLGPTQLIAQYAVQPVESDAWSID